MRLSLMFKSSLTAAALTLALTLPASAQFGAPPPQAVYKDTSMIKPPAGAKVAIYEFEDLECPACARAYPLVHAAAAQYHVPIVRHDFPLKMHIWSYDAAVNARYMQDKISPEFAEEYRSAVFKQQTGIASKDDLRNFTTKFMQSHGKAMPFVIDPVGRFKAEVDADFTLGDRIGLNKTPTIWVVTARNFVEVQDATQLPALIQQAQAQLAPTTPAHAHPIVHKAK